jgi:hypothetical protein
MEQARTRDLTCLSSVFCQGVALFAYVALYICFVSAVVDTMNVWSGRMPAWGSFWGSISPYTMLYTSGKCLNRLGALGTPAIVVALCYVVTRVRFASKKTVSSIMILNVDFVVNRFIVASIQTSYKSVGSACVFGSLAFFCCIFVVVKRYPRMAVNTTVQSLIGVLALAMAREAIALISNDAISLMISLSTVIVMSLMSASLDWPGKVACMGVSLSLSGLLQHGPTLGASGSEVFVDHWVLLGARLLMCGPDLQETLAMYSILFSLLHVVRAGWGVRRVNDSIIHIVELSHPHAPLGIVG